MLRVKILINLQVGSVRVKASRYPLLFKGSIVARFTWKPSRGSIPFYQRFFALGKVAGGICSARIDFQLGTNAEDTNGLNF